MATNSSVAPNGAMGAGPSTGGPKSKTAAGDRAPRPTDAITVERYFCTPLCFYDDFTNGTCRDPAFAGHFDLGDEGTKRDAVRLMREWGWRFVGGVWLCPDCVKGLANESLRLVGRRAAQMQEVR